MATTAESLPEVRTHQAVAARGVRGSRWGFLFTGPFFVLYVLFLLWPVLSAARTSLFDESLVGHSAWRGLKNYGELLGDSNWWAAMWHTALFTLLSTPPLVLIALGLALLVSRVSRLRWLFRLAFFAPYVLPVSVVVLIWNWLYQPGFGLINSYLTSLGLGEVNWLGQPFVAMVSVVIATVWWAVGFNFVLYLAITAGTILTASMAAFAFSRVRFRASSALQWLVLSGLIIPFQALIVPLFAELNSWGLADTYWGIILPQLASPIAVLVFKRAFDAVPAELEESALVDGASLWRIYWQIWMPLSRATIAAVGIFTFVLAWNNFIWPFVITSAGDLFTIPVGLATVNASYGALYAQQMALAILGALPLLVIFVLFQRQIVQGIANTGLKG